MKAKNSNVISDQPSKCLKFFCLLMGALICAGLAVSGADAAALSHAPMMGAVTDTTANIWIRADASASALIQYQLAGGNWSQPLQSATVNLIGTNDFTATFSLSGLSASTVYEHRVLLDGVVQPSSTSGFKTFAPSGSGSQFSFIFGADIHPAVLPHTPFTIMAAEQPDFAVLLGDQMYHTVDSGTESEFWTLYKANRDVNFQNFAKRTPIFTVWDDGDFGLDNGDSSYPWKSLARAAHAKYWANPPFVEANGGIYYKFSVADVDFFMLDSRWARIPGITMLGAAQLQWLKTQLLASTARFKFIVSPVMVSDFGTTGADSWRGFAAERLNLFQYITANNIKNIIFLSGDQHWAGAFLINHPVFQIGHGIQGFYEIEPTPFSAFKLGSPSHTDPQVLFEAGKDNFYGLARVDTTVVPRQVQIEIHSGSTGAMVYSLKIEEFTPTQTPTVVTSFLPQGTVNTPYSQALTAVDGITPYQWQVTNGALPPGLSLSPNGVISGTPTQAATFFLTARVQDSTLAGASRIFSLTINSDIASSSLLNETFSAFLRNWTIVDEGNLEGPSIWVLNNGQLTQQSNIYGGATAASDPVKPGTFVYAGNPSWNDYEFNASLLSQDDDAIGVMFRYQNRQNYYRFSMDREQSYRRLTKTVNGVTTILAQDAVAYQMNRWYAVKVRVNGNTIQVYIDGILLFNVTDSSLATGMVGLYCWGNLGSYFDDVTVSTIAAHAPPPPTITTNGLPNGTVNAPYSQGLAAAGGIFPNTWSLISGLLPAGLTLSSNGTISGTPSIAGTSTFVVQVRDSAPQTAAQTLTLTIVAAAVTVSANPTTIVPGGSVTVSWSGIASPAARDWIGLYTPGGADTSYLAWNYVSCTQTAGSGLVSGSCSMGVPGTLANGNYELRLFTNGSYIRLATSNPFSVNVSTLPVVSLAVTDGTATEGNASDTGVFTVSRTGSTATSLTVNYTVGGTATNGVDYQNLSGSVTIGSGQSSAPIIVTTIDDSLVEGSETVVVTLSANSGYTVGSPPSGTLTIVDNDTAAGPSLTASPASVAPGTPVTASWSGIASPTARDWIGQYGVGAADGNYLSWIYVSCSQTAGNGAASGACSFGLPTSLANGNYELRLFANNGFTRLATSNTFTVAPGTSPLAIVPSTLAAGTSGVAYNQTLAASGGTAPYVWSVSSGTLPAGLALSQAGAITGAPTAAGAATFAVQARDNVLATATRSFSLTINPPANPTISLSYDGLLRDRVGQAELALISDGKLDGVFTVRLNAGSGNRTVTRLYLTNAPGGIWDTQAPDSYWSLGVASAWDGALLNSANDAVNFPLNEGNSFKIFAADYQNLMFVNGTAFTLTANFADGSTATASATINALPAFSDNFSGTLSNWTFVDQGTFEGPSSWVISNGELIQRSNIYGGSTSASDPVKPGTYAIAGNALWQDYDFSLRLMSEDDDGIGAMFRFTDNSNYYRFSMDRERAVRRLVKVVNGVTTILAQDNVPYAIGQAYDLRISVTGNHIQIYLNQVLIFDVLDAALSQGRIALYCWGNVNSHFDDVVVTPR